MSHTFSPRLWHHWKRYSRQEYTVFKFVSVFVCKQGLIKLHDIQKKCTKGSNLRPDYILGEGGIIAMPFGKNTFNQKY